MLSRLVVLSSISIVALTACATPQENPYYKYSSKYKGNQTTTVAQAESVIHTAPISYESAPVPYQAESVSYETSSQSASYTRVNHECLQQEKTYELQDGTESYGLGNNAVNCDPQTVMVQQSLATVAQPYISPTDSGFESISETGTPGYQVLQSQTGEVYQAPAAPQTSAAEYAIGAKEVAYDYAPNTITVSANTFAIPSETHIMSSGLQVSHIVQEGDTVYSLSRKLCVGLADIQSLNGLDAAYGIKIGDTLHLPSSKC